MEDAKRGIGLTEDDKKQVREKLRAAWVTQANEQLQNDQAAGALETAGGILKRFEGDRDAQLLLARAHLRLRDYAAALADLNKLGNAADLPNEYRPLTSALLLLANGNASKTPGDWTKLVDGFIEFAALEKSAAPPPALALNSAEREQLTLLRGRMTDTLKPILETLPADQRKALLDKLDQVGGNSELELVKVKTALDEKHYDDARNLLAAASAKIPADASDVKAEAAAIGVLIALQDPATKPADAAKAIADSVKLLGSLTASSRSDLCTAATARALQVGPPLLEPAIELVSKTRDLDPGEAATLQLAQLLAVRITLRAAEPALPSKEELPKIIADCEQIAEAGYNNGTVDAFHAECMLAQDSRDRQTMTALVERAKPVDGYTQFIQARVLRAMSQPDWAKIAALVTSSYGADPAKYPAILAVPFRRAAAAKLLIEVAEKKRAPPPTTAAAVLANPFGDAKTADEAFQWLQLGRDLSNDIESLDLKGNKHELWVNLALAAAWKSKPAVPIARMQGARLAEVSDGVLVGDFYPMLLVAFRNHGGEPAEQAAAIQTAQRMIAAFQKQFPVADQQAAGDLQRGTETCDRSGRCSGEFEITAGRAR